MSDHPTEPRLRQLLEALPGLAAQPRELQDEIAGHARDLSLANGEFAAMEGQACSVFPIVIDGQIRVYAMNAAGREITLYHVGPNESCVLFVSSILAGEPFPAFACAESPVKSLVLPAGQVTDWTRRHDFWRQYICSLLATRLSEVIGLLKQVTFERVECRLARYLLDSVSAESSLRATHAEIASEIGTSREVVSRVLKDFESAGLMTQERGIVLLHRPRELAERIARRGRPS